MKKKIIGIFVCMLLIATVLPVSGNVDVESTSMLLSSGNTLYVGGNGTGNYTRIQDAIDNASDGDTVFVYDDSSPYYESVVIDKSINLIGENRDSTIIDNQHLSVYIIEVQARVNISKFTIQGTRRWDIGIGLHSDYNRISNNIIQEHMCAISSMNSSHNQISNNIITGNLEAINIRGSHNKIIKNTISHIRDSGISLQNTFNNSISGNIIKYCNEGICIYRSSHDIISRNIVQNNTVGIFIVLTSDTKVIQNDFIDNDISVRFARSLRVELWLKARGILGIGPKCYSMLKPFARNIWYGNYWGELYEFPYLIYGYRGDFRTSHTEFMHNVLNFLNFRDTSIFNSVAIDWHPAREPYDIPTGGVI